MSECSQETSETSIATSARITTTPTKMLTVSNTPMATRKRPASSMASSMAS